MFKYDNIPAWFLRLAIFCCLFSTYPLINHFTKTILKNLIWKNAEVARSKEVSLNIMLSFIPLLFALFYPNVGVITTYIGAVAGFLLIYLLPVLVHLKRMRLRIM
jgi:sodium-coupled neutral amino acid transporter 9